LENPQLGKSLAKIGPLKVGLAKKENIVMNIFQNGYFSPFLSKT
jgi:hypothetical protein